MENDNGSILAWAASTVANHVKNIPAAIKKDLTQGSGPSIGLEAVNDIRGSIHGVFFGQAESQSLPGTPMNPLQSEVAESRRADAGMDAEKKGTAGSVHGSRHKRPSPSEIANSTTLYGQKSHDNSQVAAIGPEGWVDRLTKERDKANQGSDDATGQNERARGRSLPDEQREQDKSRGR